MNMKQLVVFWFSLVAAIGTFETQDDIRCEIFEPHITLGDAFRVDSSPADSHPFTVGLTLSPHCRSPPLLVLRGAPSLSERSRPHFLRKDVDVRIGDEQYTRSGLFFRIESADVADGYRSWEVRLDGRLWHSVESIPSRLLSAADELRLFVIADFDNTPTAEPTWHRLETLDADRYDMVLHVGDFAYEIWSDGGRRGDQYFARASRHNRRVPFVMTPGNHENFADGTLLNYRFRMPNAADDNAMFDFVAKGVYFMFVNLDWVLRYTPWENLEYKSRERAVLEWMEERHRLVSRRTDIKWRVFSSHRPFECSSIPIDRDCTVNHYFFRKIADQAANLGFQFALNAHLHAYVRHKTYHGLVPQPDSKIGKGALFTVISGHSGTEYFLHNESFIPIAKGPYVEKVDVSGPTYLDLMFNKRQIIGKLIRTDNQDTKDQFSLIADLIYQDPSSKVTFLVVLTVLVGISLLAFIFYWYLRRTTKNSSDGYIEPNFQEGTSMMDTKNQSDHPN